MINFVFRADRQRAPITLALLGSILVCNVGFSDNAAIVLLVGLIGALVSTIAFRLRGAPMAMLLQQLLTALGARLAIDGAVMLTILVTPLDTSFSYPVRMSKSVCTLCCLNPFGMFSRPALVLRGYLLWIRGFPLSALCAKTFAISQVKLMCGGFAARLAPGMKAVTSGFVTAKVFGCGREFSAALCAAFQRGGHTTPRKCYSHVFGEADRRLRRSLFGSYPRPLHLNYTTDVA